ncbi:HAD family hydrolase [Arsenicicoccus cauae]|uniref:HAD family hydrolase n=1 Tax=Arsenicicoccus cauae TaxID=2663847 RepID=UPI00370CFFFF
MTKAHPIDTLLLDADGVLQYLPKGWASEVLGHPRWPGMQALLDVEAPFLTGQRTDGFPEAIAELLRTSGVDLPVEAFFAAWSLILIDQRALELVDQVRARGVKVHLATNQQSMRAAIMRDQGLDDHFDGAYYSYELGCKKPDRAYFDHIVRDLRVQRDRVLFVDDTWVNVEGARRAGIRAAHKPYADGVAGLERVLRWHGVL